MQNMANHEMATLAGSVTSQTISLRPLFWGLAIFVMAIVGPLTALYAMGDFLIMMLVGLLAIYLGLAIFNFARVRYIRALSYILPHIAVVILILCGALFEKVASFNIADAIKFQQFSRAECIRSASDLGNGKMIGVCVSHHNNIADTASAIIYDSSDEIALPPQKQSSRWKDISSKLKDAPFGALNFSARSMGRHFYDIEFSES